MLSIPSTSGSYTSTEATFLGVSVSLSACSWCTSIYFASGSSPRPIYTRRLLLSPYLDNLWESEALGLTAQYSAHCPSAKGFCQVHWEVVYHLSSLNLSSGGYGGDDMLQIHCVWRHLIVWLSMLNRQSDAPPFMSSTVQEAVRPSPDAT